MGHVSRVWLGVLIEKHTVVLVQREPSSSRDNLTSGLIIPVRVGTEVGLAAGDNAAHVAVGRGSGEESQSRNSDSDGHGSVLRVGEHVELGIGECAAQVIERVSEAKVVRLLERKRSSSR